MNSRTSPLRPGRDALGIPVEWSLPRFELSSAHVFAADPLMERLAVETSAIPLPL